MNKANAAKYLSENPAMPRCVSLRYDDLASLVAGVKSVVYVSLSGSEEARCMDTLCSELKFEKLTLGNNKNICGGQQTVDILIGTNLKKMKIAAKNYNNPGSFEWGAALDYPECCVKAYLNWRFLPAHRSLVYHTCAGSPKNMVFSFLLNNVCNYYSRLYEAGAPAAWNSFSALNRNFDLDPIIPWHPCTYACARSLAGGRKIYEVLAHYMPHMAAFRRSSLSKPVIFWDNFRFAFLDGACRAEGGGFVVTYKGVCRPRSLLGRGTGKTLNRCSELRISPAGRIVRPRALPLPKDYILLPFASG